MKGALGNLSEIYTINERRFAKRYGISKIGQTNFDWQSQKGKW